MFYFVKQTMGDYRTHGFLEIGIKVGYPSSLGMGRDMVSPQCSRENGDNTWGGKWIIFIRSKT